MDESNGGVNIGELVSAETGTVGLIAKAEIDQQIATAKKYPRSVVQFRKEALQLVTLTEQIASECIYALPRRERDKETGQWVTKVIEGPSARFAEIIAFSWKNARSGARVVNEGEEFVTAQGVFQDVENNVCITYEVQRRITDSKGKRYGADMIGVTANAACSIALRNAVLRGVPKAFWSDLYAAARKVAAGDATTLVNKRSNAIKAFQIYGINEAQLLALLGKAGIADVTIDDLVTLNGFLTAIKDGDMTPEQLLANLDSDKQGIKMPTAKKSAEAPKEPAAAETPAPSTTSTRARQDSTAAGADEPLPMMNDGPRPGPTPTRAQPPEDFAETPAPTGMVRMIRAKINAAELQEASVLAKFGVKSLDGMSMDVGRELLDWLQTSAGQ
jgi:hypothetical protein